MFNYLKNVSLPIATSSSYYAITLLEKGITKQQASKEDVFLNLPLSDTGEDKKVAVKILGEIENKEHKSIAELPRESVRLYVDKITTLIDEMYSKS